MFVYQIIFYLSCLLNSVVIKYAYIMLFCFCFLQLAENYQHVEESRSVVLNLPNAATPQYSSSWFAGPNHKVISFLLDNYDFVGYES